MRTIYRPTGNAGEYAELACNLYQGCGHGCVYCYAPGVLRVKREDFHDPSQIRPRDNILRELQAQAGKMAGDKRPILLCFTSDPYQPREQDLQITRGALEILADSRLQPQILTKAGPWAIERDLDILQRCNGIWAATLTTDDAEESGLWKPQAALPEERIQALRTAKKAGLQTWVSFEPVYNTQAVLRLIERTSPFVDVFKVGKLNRHSKAGEIDWAQFLKDVEARLNAVGADYYLKNDLRKYGEAVSSC